MQSLGMTTLIYTLIPVSAAIIGAAIAAYRRPGPIVVSAIQHFRGRRGLCRGSGRNLA
ncbi:exported hypothetical protein [Mesorhizobium metallidurans STM 2683]|uniref:Uncharacterized protein n=1 Tax=Mesorhizobium metallidurans STM 2683 TaxID=1297569 RepID=M5F931_9HYPH|nr:exported hypothetical protein [Mesorhizobium metallidurans STM 2683]